MSRKKGSKYFSAALKAQIEEMKELGKTHKEIAVRLGMGESDQGVLS